MSCRYCENFEIWKGDGYCNYWRSNVNGSDTCQKDTSDRGAGHEEDDDYSNGTCYITTIACHKMGFNDDCLLLNTLRDFRESYLKNSFEYSDILNEYDIVGPIISDKMLNDSNGFDLSQEILIRFLFPIKDLIMQKNFNKAIVKYSEMVNQLIARYNLKIL